MLRFLSFDPVIGSALMLASLGTLVGAQGLHAERADGLARALTVRGQPAQAIQIARAGTLQHHVVARAHDGMFYLTATANGQPIRFLVDTGSSITVLTPADARRMNMLDPSSETQRTIATASGTATGAVARIAELNVGGRNLPDTPVLVLETGVGSSLIGQDVLRQLGPITFDGDSLLIES